MDIEQQIKQRELSADQQATLEYAVERGRKEERFMLAVKLLARGVDPVIIKEATYLSDQDLRDLEV